MSYLSYPSLRSILEYVEANKRSHLSLQCPSLRRVDNSVPLHMDKLAVSNVSIHINDEIYWNSYPQCLRERELVDIFENRQSVINVDWCDLSRSINRIPIKSIIRPTNLFCEEYYSHDAVFGKNVDKFCTRNLKMLWTSVFDRSRELFSHPLLPQLEHLHLNIRHEKVLPHQGDLFKLPIPQLTLSIQNVDIDMIADMLKFWIQLKKRGQILTVCSLHNSFQIVVCLASRIDLKRDSGGKRLATVTSDSDSDSDSKVLIMWNPTLYSNSVILKVASKNRAKLD